MTTIKTVGIDKTWPDTRDPKADTEPVTYAKIRWEGPGFYIWFDYATDMPHGGWIKAGHLEQLEEIANNQGRGWHHFKQRHLVD
jgi:hypothetical protein